MRFIVVVGILALVLVAVVIQGYLIFQERNKLKETLSDLDSRLEALLSENAKLRSELEYFSHPENLEKELRSKFNYHYPDEKMMIIVP
jgi:cell division protein FtsB